MNLFTLLIYLILIAYIIRTLRNVLYILFLWQLKEYRWDRMLAHLHTPAGRKIWLNPISIAKTVLIAIFIFSLVSFTSVQTSQSFLFIYFTLGFSILFFWLFWLLEAILNIRELFTRGWLKPKFTVKVFFVFVTVLIFQFPYLAAGEITSHQILLGIFSDRLLNPIVALLITLTNIPSIFYKKRTIALAKNKIAQFKNLTVIGITGSYGKTSTKEFLATILSEKYKVAKTADFNNTDIGVAKCVLRDLNQKHEIFVVEMGAYKRGEIKSICDMVRPKIGIITGINEQHMELFGSLENTKKTKFELIESLPEDGTAIFNGNNSHCLEMATWAKNLGLATIVYDQNKETGNRRAFKNHLEFKFNYRKKGYTMSANLLGEYNTENILAAMHAALYCGVNIDEVQKGIAHISSPAKTMKLIKAYKNIFLVDDTFNSNPDGVIAAMKYMQIFSGEKILILTPLIELGEESKKVHRMLGKESAKICDLILLTNSNYNDSFMQGAEEWSRGDRVKLITDKLMHELLNKNLKKDSILIFEGKEAGKILNRLTNNNDF